MRVHARAIGVVWVIAFAAVVLFAWPGRAFATATSAPTLSAPVGQTAVKNGNTLTFGGTAGGTSPSISSATLRQYSDTAATTEITGSSLPITLTVGSDISLSSGTISGTKAVTFDSNAVRVKLEVVILDSDATTQTGTSTALTVDNTPPTASAVTFLDGSSGTGPFKSSASVTMSVTASESLSTAPVVTFSGAGTPAVTLTGSGTSWSGTVTSLSGNGAVTYTMVLTDGVGNTTTTSSASAFTVDNTGPAIALTYAIASSVPANAAAAAQLTYSASASRPVKGGEVVVVKAVATETNALASAISLSLDGSRTISAIGTLGASDTTAY
ncbi:MAG: hypothetical protein ACKO2D_02225, partial [Chloroflexota bacterium]